MANNTVQLAQLRVMAEYFTTTDYPYFEELREAFQLLKLTGCRIQEIFDITRWTQITGYQVQLQPQKFNNPRIIILNSSFDNFLAAIVGQYKPFIGRTYSQLQYLFSKINIYGKIYSGNKEITNYFFRYLYVREMQDIGFTDLEIATEMGYTTAQAVSNYLNAVLESTIEVPVSSAPIVDGVEYETIETPNLLWTLKPFYTSFGGIPSLFPENDSDNVPLFGLLYRADAYLTIKNYLPDGWRLPTIADFQDLIDYSDTFGNSGTCMKSSGLDFWDKVSGTDNFGYQARGCGWSLGGGAAFFKNQSIIIGGELVTPSTVCCMHLYSGTVNPAYNTEIPFHRSGSYRMCKDK